MSLGADRKYILCDSVGCQAKAAVPVALHPRLANGQQDARTTEGWLYVVSNGKEEHFCPLCTQQRLKALSGNARPASGAMPRSKLRP